MALEKPGYREQLEDITTFFGAKRVLTRNDVVRYTGLNPRTVIKRYFDGDTYRGITTVQLARKLVT